MAAGDEHGSLSVRSAHGINGDRMVIRSQSSFVRQPACSSVSSVFVAVGHRILVVGRAPREER